jgi:alginate O-acetyltransferase complex protein AlgI
VPLGGNKVGWTRHLVNLFFTFLISGIWHGANWTFVIWGALHGGFLVVSLIWKRITNAATRINSIHRTNPFKVVANMMITFALVNFGWIFFRADNLSDASSVVVKIFTTYGIPFLNKTELMFGLSCLTILIMKEINDEYGLKVALLSSKSVAVRYGTYLALIFIILLFGVVDSNQFIYFQF